MIASLANSSSLTGNSLGIAYPNSSVSLAEVVAALAASGLCSLPAHLSSNPPPISSGNLVPNFTFSSRASPSFPDGHQNRDTMTALSSGNMHSNLSYHQNVIQSANMSKNPAVSIHHNPSKLSKHSLMVMNFLMNVTLSDFTKSYILHSLSGKHD